MDAWYNTCTAYCTQQGHTLKCENARRRLPWVVVDAEAINPRPLAFFGTHDQAAAWIGNQEDQAKVERGGFGIDGPADELV